MKNLFWIFLIIYGISSTAFSQQHGSRIEKLSKNSDLILTGKVVHQNSSWNENKTRIYTKATLKVDEYLKGNNTGNSVEFILVEKLTEWVNCIRICQGSTMMKKF
jgi:hypothetical protein